MAQQGFSWQRENCEQVTHGPGSVWTRLLCNTQECFPAGLWTKSNQETISELNSSVATADILIGRRQKFYTENRECYKILGCTPVFQQDYSVPYLPGGSNILILRTSAGPTRNLTEIQNSFSQGKPLVSFFLRVTLNTCLSHTFTKLIHLLRRTLQRDP